ncbi:MAG: DegT/DnrJ/EryC1/StrS aminotransferase family protein [Candidatus Andersenbacteria bacterium]|nr:DegT/DnrJ/EryC1/StrS aminotransferase family protein [Candidatus Andersenbacteria bacterium]
MNIYYSSLVISLTKSTFYNDVDTAQKLSSFVLSAKQLSFGEQCNKFEEQFAQYQGRKHCVLMNSGSSANLALIQALRNIGKIKLNDTIGFSAVTWSTNVMPIIQLGLAAVPIDIELDTLNISPQTIRKVLETTSLKAIFLTHLLGFCDDLQGIRELCAQEKILLIEDTCEALGSVYHGNKLGNFGIASTFSFYVGHHLSTIEGGAVCTDDDELATMLRIVRAHGWDRNLPSAEQSAIRQQHSLNSIFESRYTFYDLGFNLRPTEITGYLGTIQLPYIHEIIQKRNQNFIRLAPAIYEQTDKYYPLHYDHIDLVSNFAIPIVCRTRKQRDLLVSACNERIEIRPIVGGNIASQPFFCKYVPEFSQSFKNSNASIIHDQGLYFGNNPLLTEIELQELHQVFAG